MPLEDQPDAPDETLLLGEDDDAVDFGDDSELNAPIMGISRLRWERVRADIDIGDVLLETVGHAHSPMSCPFHGRDSTPSFYIFRDRNWGYCFGCPDEDGTGRTQIWDAIRIVAETEQLTKPGALRWLEAKFNLPFLADDAVSLDEAEDETTEETGISLTVEDLKAPYLKQARLLIQAKAGTSEAVPTAVALLDRYFRCIQQETPLPMARLLGKQALGGLMRAKT